MKKVKRGDANYQTVKSVLVHDDLEGVTEYELNVLLNVIEADRSDLRGLLNVLQNLVSLRDELLAICRPVSRGEVSEWLAIATEILGCKQAIVATSESFYVDPQWTDARVTDLYQSRPIYALLFHESSSECGVYRLLQAHGLLALHLLEDVTGSQRDAWARELRRAGHTEYDDLRKVIGERLGGAGRSADAFQAILQALEKSTAHSAYRKLVTPLRRFFDIVVGKNQSDRACKTPHLGAGRASGSTKSRDSAPVGVRRKHVEAVPFDIPVVGMTEAKPRPKVSFFRITESNPTDSGGKSRALGLSGGEFASTQDVAAADKAGLSTGFYSRCDYEWHVRQQKRALTKQLSLAPLSYERLTGTDLRVLYEDVLTQWDEVAGGGSAGERQEAAELAALVELSFLTGRSIDQLLRATYTAGLPGETVEIETIHWSVESHALLVVADFGVHPPLGHAVAPGMGRNVSRVLPLPVPSSLAQRLKTVVLGSGKKGSSHKKLLFPISAASPEQAQTRIKRVLRAANDQRLTRLTRSRIQQYLYRSAAALPAVGRLRASFLVGTLDPVTRVPAAYAALSVPSLVADYQQVLSDLPQTVDVGPVLPFGRDVKQRYYGCFVGSRRVPTKAALRGVVDELRSSARQGLREGREGDVFAALNTRTIYMGYRMVVESGYRVVKAMFPHTTDLVSATGVGVISDKDFADYSHARIVTFTPGCSQQHQELVALQEKHASLIVSITGVSRAMRELGSIFIPSPNREAEKRERQDYAGAFTLFCAHTASPLSVEAFRSMLSEIFAFPANAHRHYLASWLHARRVPFPLILGVMGHVAADIGPWSPYSRLSLDEYAERMRRQIMQMVAQLGFERV